MRRATAWGVVVGVLAACTAIPSTARADGFWTTIAAGASGSAAPSDYSEFWFDSPHGPPIAVTELSGTTAQAITGGGTTFFSPPGTPVLLPTSDGYATLTNPDVTNGSGGLPRFAGGNSGIGSAGHGPARSTRLEQALRQSRRGGRQRLARADGGRHRPNGNPLGSGQVTLPDGGWWVIGIGPGQPDGQTPPPDPDPIGGGGGDGGNPIPDPPPPPDTSGGGSNNGGGGGPVATPEPTTAMLLGLGGGRPSPSTAGSAASSPTRTNARSPRSPLMPGVGFAR